MSKRRIPTFFCAWTLPKHHKAQALDAANVFLMGATLWWLWLVVYRYVFIYIYRLNKLYDIRHICWILEFFTSYSLMCCSFWGVCASNCWYVTNGTIDINICEFQRVKSTSYPPVNVYIAMENGPVIVVLPIWKCWFWIVMLAYRVCYLLYKPIY